MLDGVGPRGLQQVEGPPDVNVQPIGERKGAAPAVPVPVQGEMEHDVNALGCVVDRATVRHPSAPVVASETEEFQLGGADFFEAAPVDVEDSHAVSVIEQRSNEPGPDEPGSASN